MIRKSDSNINNYENLVTKIIKYMIVAAIAVIIITKIIIECNWYSRGTNDGWLSFIGGLAGGCFGGIGTMLAIYITIKQTRDIQFRIAKEGIVNDIAKYISGFTSDAKEYFYGRRSDRKISQEMYFLLKIHLGNYNNTVWEDMTGKILVLAKDINENIDEYKKKDEEVKFNNKCDELINETFKFVTVYRNDGKAELFK